MAGLVGREPELAVIESFLAADEAGSAELELVGEAGIGKTTVWQAAVRRGRELGLPVLSARPAESEARLSFAGLTDLLVAVDADVLGTLPAPQAEALDVALLRAGASRSPGRRLVGTALLSVLRELTSRGPVLSRSTTRSGSTRRRPRCSSSHCGVSTTGPCAWSCPAARMRAARTSSVPVRSNSNSGRSRSPRSNGS